MRRTKNPLSSQIKQHSSRLLSKTKGYDGETKLIISTGSTLLDLAISGGRVRGGGIPGGVLVEIFGPSGTGKTILLCEIAGAIQRQGGQIMFKDPEARLNKQFARLFGLKVDEMDYDNPDTIPEAFAPVREWSPKPNNVVHGIFTDSLAALSTNMELEGADKYGMRRAKEFSEELRKTCRTIRSKNFLMVCSNQVRQNIDAGPYGQKYVSPGGEAIGFYSSLRLRCLAPKKITKKKEIGKKTISRTIGVKTEIEVFKSSIWKPYYKAELYILFDYGIDDIRGNLQYIKDISGLSSYQLRGEKLSNSLDKAVLLVERHKEIAQLKEEVISTWEENEQIFHQKRIPKKR